MTDAVIIFLILILLGLAVLSVIFFSNGGSKVNAAAGGSGREREAKKVQELIKKLEKENPEMVSKIRSQVMAERKLANVKDTGQDEISEVVKHWMADK